MSGPLAAMAAQVCKVNEANGWFTTDRMFGDDIALLHSEVSEAFEAYRDHGFEDFTGDDTVTHDSHGRHVWPAKPEGVGSEFADVLIRLLDSAHRAGIDLDAEFRRKLAYNGTRGFRYGGKRL